MKGIFNIQSTLRKMKRAGADEHKQIRTEERQKAARKRKPSREPVAKVVWKTKPDREQVQEAVRRFEKKGGEIENTNPIGCQPPLLDRARPFTGGCLGGMKKSVGG